MSVENDYPIVPVGLIGATKCTEPDHARRSVGSAEHGPHEKLSGRADMAMPIMHGIGPTMIPRPQRMYLRFGAPIETTKPARISEAKWVDTVKQNTQESLEQILADLLVVRSDDPYRELNPLAWRSATQPSSEN